MKKFFLFAGHPRKTAKSAHLLLNRAAQEDSI